MASLWDQPNNKSFLQKIPLQSLATNNNVYYADASFIKK
jgi:hypothetical protein